MSATLFKLFLGPAGTVTRLHADAGDAHGWLAQVWGAKLFVLYPPTDAPHLRVLPNEVRHSSGLNKWLLWLLLSADSCALSRKQRSAM
jgi:chloride channel 7